jgi:hypothetical protein
MTQYYSQAVGWYEWKDGKINFIPTEAPKYEVKWVTTSTPTKLKCKKCGSTNITLHYHTGFGVVKEWLTARCQRCKYDEDLECGDYGD